MIGKIRSVPPVVDPLVNRTAIGGEEYLNLYITGTTPNSRRAKVNLIAALREIDFPADCRLKIIDVLTDAMSAITASVVVTPTLVALRSNRRLVMIGDLSDSIRLKEFLRTVASIR